MNLPHELCHKYLVDPYAQDVAVRNHAKVPDDKYYTVSVWPKAGLVTLNGLNREVKSNKVSKSDQ